MDYKEMAREYFDKGMTVTPVKGKRPYLDRWQKLTESEALAFEWGSPTGIGLVCGEPSGIICLDIDINLNEANTAQKEFLKALESKLPPLLSGKIGNPNRLPSRFFAHSGEFKKAFQEIHVDLLATGSQTVLPPSQHPEHGAYEWVGKPLDQIDIDDLPKLPPGLIEFLELENEKLKRKSIGKVHQLRPTPGRCASGSNSKLFEEGIRLMHQGLDPEKVAIKLFSLDSIINESSDYLFFLCKTENWNHSDPLKNALEFVQKKVFTDKYYSQALDRFSGSEDMLKKYGHWVNSGFWEMTEKGGVVKHHLELSRFLIELNKIKFIPSMQAFFAWRETQFTQIYPDEIRSWVDKHMTPPAGITIADRARVFESVKHMTVVSGKQYILKDTGKINFLNGTFNLLDKKFYPHSPDDEMILTVPHNYDPQFEAPVWDEFMVAVTINRPHMQMAIEEFIGYVLSGCDYEKFNKLLILDGDGANGKSTLTRIISGLIGRENTSSVALTAITKERFAGYSLVNKLLNLCSEEPNSAFADTGPLKKLTGGDEIMVEAKHESAFSYRNLAKFIISYNKAPYFPDGSSGMRRRIILIPMEQNFEKHPELKIQNPESRILDKEASAVIYRCIERYLAAMDRGFFTVIPEGDKKVEELVTTSDATRAFFKECVIIYGHEEDEKRFVSNTQFYNAFEEFLGKKPTLTKHQLTAHFKNYLKSNGYDSDLYHCYARRDGSMVRGFKHVDVLLESRASY